MLNSEQNSSFPIILASASPRRRELMERFWEKRLQIRVPRFDEQTVLPRNGLAQMEKDVIRQAALTLSERKIIALREQFVLPARYCAVAADTLVVIDGRILGKPTDQAEARSQLLCLSGRAHLVMTGLSVCFQEDDQNACLQAVEETTVYFTTLDDSMITWYLDTGEPFDKAGSYGIQGAGAALIERIDGCYYNVMGLPVSRLISLLREAAEKLNSFHGLNHLLPWG